MANIVKKHSISSELDQRNKTFVLEAFETLFNRKDFVAAEKFWSPNYIQHSAHIPPGRDGLFALIKSARPR
jgi:predicted SnoaL-like aldol condensation-catalyzing enzyme